MISELSDVNAPLAEFTHPLDALFRARPVPAHVGVQQLVVVGHAADEVPLKQLYSEYLITVFDSNAAIS